MQEIGVRGPTSTGGLLHHHVHHVHHVHHQLSSAHASVHTSSTSDATSTVTTASPSDADRQSSGEEEGSSPCHSPIDLSSGATTTPEVPMIAGPPPAALTSALNSASASSAMTASTMDSNSSSHAAAFLTARKFAEFLHAQQQQQQQQRQKELNETTPPTTTTTASSHDVIRAALMCPKKRRNEENEIRECFDEEEDESVTKLEDDSKQSLMPLELIRARWESKEVRAESPSAKSADGSSSGSSCPGETAGGQGREVKKRRLDELLSKKFSVTDSPPNSASSSISPPPVVSSSTPSQQQQNGNVASVKRVNRRKPTSPISSHTFASPILPPSSTASILTVRPPSELFAKNMTPSPNHLPRQSPVPRNRSKSPRRENHHQLLLNNINNIKQEERESELKGQLMQLQLAQAALLSGAVASSTTGSPAGNGFPGLSGAAGNPLLYYGYYAQMLQGLQAQQQKLLEQLQASQKQRFMTSSPSATSTNNEATSKLLMSSPSHGFPHLPLLTANDSSKRHSPFSPPSFSPRLSSSSPPFTPTSGSHFMGHHHDPEGSLSPLAGDEPRRRAPRALTGRYVRTGTGASPRVLQILRKKIEERLKLKELLGENSHLYFGALNKNKKNVHNNKSKQQQQQHRNNASLSSPSISVNNKF